MLESLDHPPVVKSAAQPSSAVVTLCIGKDQRLFAAHEAILATSSFFEEEVRKLFYSVNVKRIDLPHEDPETFSCVLEYLYRGDYTPRIVQNKARGAYIEGGLEDITNSPQSMYKNNGTDTVRSAGATIFHTIAGETILRDTAVYCAAGRYDLPDLQRLALRKQGLCSGVDVSTILKSARFAYANTPDSDSKLRAHFLALIIRARKTFKRSGTMQREMMKGSAIWFDLFVALCTHLDDLSDSSHTPKTV